MECAYYFNFCRLCHDRSADSLKVRVSLGHFFLFQKVEIESARSTVEDKLIS